MSDFQQDSIDDILNYVRGCERMGPVKREKIAAMYKATQVAKSRCSRNNSKVKIVIGSVVEPVQS